MGHEIVQAYEEHVLPVLEKFQAGKCGSATHLTWSEDNEMQEGLYGAWISFINKNQARFVFSLYFYILKIV